MKNAFKSFYFAVGLILFTVLVIYITTRLDSVFNLQSFQSMTSVVAGVISVALGTIVRLWAAFTYYQHGLKVIHPTPQRGLVTSGPFHYSRNPLYIGIIFITFGVALLFGSTSGLGIAVLVTLIFHIWALHEEKDLEKKFGELYLLYKERTPRWLFTI